MSQKKVEAYKEYKKNREQIIKKEKRSLAIEKFLVGLVCVALVGWLGFSIYESATRPPEGEEQVTEIDVNAYEEYVNDLDLDFAE